MDVEQDLLLKAPEGVPVPFTVRIGKGGTLVLPAYTFEISGAGVSNRNKGTGTYHLSHLDHNAFLDLYEQLSRVYGMRLAQNRKPPFEPSFKAHYREVLLQNLAPGMLYGYGDPAVIRVEDAESVWFYLLVTSNDAPDAFPILRSPNLVDWEFAGYVFPQGQTPPWAVSGALVSDFWAPEMHRFSNEFRVYFVAREKGSPELCIGVARSQNPQGPFVADAAPIIRGNVIDPHIFQTDDTTAYLYWKKDNNDLWPQLLIRLLHRHPYLIAQLFRQEEDLVTASFVVTIWPWIEGLEPIERFMAAQVFIESVTANFLAFYELLDNLQEALSDEIKMSVREVLDAMKTPVYAQPLSPDGSALVGTPTKIIENDLAWEAHLVEGIWVTKQEEHYYLFYAGNDFSTDQYGIGVAVASSPLGLFVKMQKPLLQSTAAWWSPGHPSLAVGPDGKPQLFLHAYFPGKAGYKQLRVLLAATLAFSNGHVHLG